MIKTLGVMTMALNIIMVCVGVPAQIIKNHREKKCGNPLVLMILIFAVYSTRSIYTAAIGIWYILIPDVLGTIFSIVIIFQAYHYRSSK